MHPAQWLPAVGTLGALVGIGLTLWFNSRNERTKRQFDFLHTQMQDFYSPLLSIRQRISALSELRGRVATASNAAWVELVEEAKARGGVEEIEKLRRERSPDFHNIIEYENEQLKTELLPAYKQMLEIFRAKFWLAEAQTRVHFNELVVFVELWTRYLNKTIPSEAIVRLNLTEERLAPLYDDLQKRFDDLQQRLSSGRSKITPPPFSARAHNWLRTFRTGPGP